MNKRLQVFISSTYLDLKEERQAAVEEILKAGHIPAGMELFAAGDESQWETIKRWIDGSDIFLLILGGRYGSVEPKTTLSYTELEYDYAVSKGKKLFAVVIDEAALNKKIKRLGRDAIEMENPQKLKEFRNKVLSRTSSFYKDAKDIKINISNSIREYLARFDFTGWIPGDNTSDGVKVFDEFYKGFQHAADKVQNVTSLDIYALSTSRFVRQVADRPKFSADKVRVVLPSEAAIDVFYSRSKGRLVSNPTSAAQSIKDQIKESHTLWKNMEKIKQLGKVDIAFVDSYPLFYLGILNHLICFYGYFYTTKADLINGIVMGPTYVLETEGDISQMHIDWFNSLWDIHSKKPR